MITVIGITVLVLSGIAVGIFNLGVKVERERASSSPLLKDLRELINSKKAQLYEANEKLALEQQRNAPLILSLKITRDALRSIADQNAGQSTFEIWAKRMAQDAVERTKGI